MIIYLNILHNQENIFYSFFKDMGKASGMISHEKRNSNKLTYNLKP